MLQFEGKVVKFAGVLESSGNLLHSSNHSECSICIKGAILEYMIYGKFKVMAPLVSISTYR